MTIFTWTISAVERAISLDGLSNVIQVAHWRYRGTDENGVTAETYGATAFGDPNPQDFTPWDEVTAADVEGWLVNIMSVVPPVEEGEPVQPTQLEAMQASLEEQIYLIINPVTITGPLEDQSDAVVVEEVVV
jgi:hypothetical protein